MQLDEPLDLGDAPSALRSALYTFACADLTGRGVSFGPDGDISVTARATDPEHTKLEAAAVQWRVACGTVDSWRAQCPEGNLPRFDALASTVLPREPDAFYDAFMCIQGVGEEFRVMSMLYLLGVNGIALEYAHMMLEGVNFTRDGRIRNATPKGSFEDWSF